MKKILAILTVLFIAGAATSCKKATDYQLTEPLTLDNYDLTIPKTASKKGVNGENIHYFHITSTGPWEAVLTQQVDGETWCWLDDHYSKALTDETGAQIKDEYGRIQTEDIKVAEGVEFFPGGEEQGKYCRVRGNAGVTYLPMEYNDNSGVVRYATLRVRRLDMDYEKFTNITQNK
jgi:hypothetical protein